VTALAAALAETARQRPAAPAIVSADRTLTAAALLRAAEGVAPRLRGRITTDARNPADVAVAVVAAALADVPLLVLDARAGSEDRDRMRSSFGADLVLGPGPGLDLTPLPGAAPPASGSPPAGLGLGTSGSEGRSKCVERPWAAVTANAREFGDALGLGAGDAIACTTPPHHSYALCGGIVTALLTGVTYVGLEGRSGPRLVAEAVDAYRVTVLMSVPLLFRWFGAGAGLPSVVHRPRLCVSAGAALAAEDRKRWERTVGWPIGEHYGTTELGMLTLDRDQVTGSVGRPLAGVELRVDPAPGPGAIAARVAGPPAHLHTAGPHPESAGDGYRDTGDLGRWDADGRLFLTGRRGAMINVAGNKVPAAEVEDAIRAFPPVVDCAVVGVAAAGGQAVVAFVEAGSAVDRRALTAFLRERLAPYMLPSVVVPVAKLPRNANGKLLRSELLRLLDQS
jgi:acyl-coenzyme A synthetase/AMP-(fatty) acid ligase